MLYMYVMMGLTDFSSLQMASDLNIYQAGDISRLFL